MLCFSGLGIKSLQHDEGSSPSAPPDPPKEKEALLPSSSALELELADLGEDSDDGPHFDKEESEPFCSPCIATTNAALDDSAECVTPRLSGIHRKEANWLAGHYSGASHSSTNSLQSTPTPRPEKNREVQTITRASPNFRWSIPSEELLPKIALYLGWRKAAGTMILVSRQWHAVLRGDALWQCFTTDEFSRSERRGGWGGHELLKRCGRNVVNGSGEAKVMREFRDRYRRKVDGGLGELRTGWDWVREKLGKESLDK
jgi:hypothetical protein